MPLLLRSEEHTSELQSLRHLVCLFCLDRKSTRLNSSHLGISYAVFCLKKKKQHKRTTHVTTRAHKRLLILIHARRRDGLPLCASPRQCLCGRLHGGGRLSLFFFKGGGPPGIHPFSPTPPSPN